MKKIRSAFLILGVVLVSFIYFSSTNLISANEEKYSLTLSDRENKDDYFVKGNLKISASKDTIVSFKTENTEKINEETFLEGMPEKYKDLVVVESSEKEQNDLTLKFKASKEQYEIPMTIYFSYNHVKNGDSGKVQVSIDGELVSESKVDIPIYTDPGEAAKIELPNKKQFSEKRFADFTPFGITPVTFVPPAVTYTEVNTWAGFLAAINSNTNGIRLTADLTSANSSTASINRNLVIDGNGYKINYAGTNNHSIPIANASTTTTLTLMNLEIVNTSNSTSAIFNASAATNANWTVDISNVNTSNGNSRNLLSLPGGTVNIHNNNNWTWNNGGTAYGMIIANKINLYGSLTYSSTSSSGDLFRNTVTGAELNLAKDSQLITNCSANVFNSTGTNVDVTVDIDSSDITLTKASNLVTSSGTLSGNVTNTNINIGTTSDYLFYAKSALAIGIENSPITGNTLAGITNSGANATVNFLNSPIQVNAMNGSIVSGVSTNVTSNNSDIKIEKDYSKILFEVVKSNTDSTLNFESSNMYLRQTSKAAAFSFNSKTDISLNNSSIDFNSTSVFMTFAVSAPNSSIAVTGKSTIEGEVLKDQFINTGNGDSQCPDFNLLVDGNEAKIDVVSSSTDNGGDGGIISITGANSNFNVSNGAELDLTSTKGSPAALVQSSGGGFYVTNNSKINLSNTGDSNGLAACMRFRYVGNMTFELSDNSIMNIVKNGNAAGVRLYGGNNKIWVKSGSDFTVNHTSKSTTANDGGTSGYNQQGIQYRGDGDNQFIIDGEDSNVSIIASHGPAIDAESSINIEAADDTYFVARGMTSSNNVGIFKAKTSEFNFGTMKYFDFTNTRVGGGSVIKVNAGSTFKSSITNLSLWRRGDNVAGNPNKDFSQIQYSLSGANFDTWVSGDADLQSYLNSNGKMSNITRMNGNNQRAIIDELRVPTDADKFIYGHASVPEGKGEANRSAYTGEVNVKVDVYDSTGTTKLYSGLTGTIVEGTAGSETISVYGDAERTGIFKIDVPTGAFLTADSKIVVTDAWRGDLAAGKAIVSKPDDLIAPDRTVLDVTPPTPTALTDGNLNNATKVLSGKDAESGATVYVYYDTGDKDTGTLLTGTSTVLADGTWSYNLPWYVVKAKELSVYLEDTAGKHTAAELVPKDPADPTGEQVYDQIGLIKPPITNTATGNINPYNDVTYHDAVFKGVEKYTVKDVIPDDPGLTKASKSSGGSTTTIGDTVTYTLTAANNKNDSEPWKNIVLKDTIAEELIFDKENHGITINGVAATEDQFDYDETTRELLIYIGDVAKNESTVATFAVKVSKKALEKDIPNIAEAVGDSPQEDPFVAGPIDSDAEHIKISKKSNSVGLPGGPAFGTLALESAPTAIDFKQQEFKAAKKTRVNDPDIIGDGLIVSDTRKDLKSWTLTCKLTKPMLPEGSSDMDYVLPDAIRYKTSTEEKIITDAGQAIVVHKNDSRGDHDISSTWTADGEGFKFEVPAGKVSKLGNYQATMLLVLGDTP